MKKNLLLPALIFFLLPLLSNSQEIQWQNTIGGNNSDFLYSVTETSDGGYILGGYSLSDMSGDKTENSNGGYDFWLLKTDISGAIQWQNTIGGNGWDELRSISQTSDGGYILGGSSQSNISGDKTENCIGNWDYWIVKTNGMGVIQWQNTIGGAGEDYLHSIAQTSDGGYILGGYSNSNISGDKTEYSFGSDDYWIVKTDSLGTIQWQNTIGGIGDDNLLSLAQTTDGGYILGGSSKSNISGDKTENSNGSWDYWIVKTDNLGVIQWQNTIGGSGGDDLSSVIQTADGGYILGGHSDSNISGDKTENSFGSDDYWIVKTDNLGAIQWQNTIGGSAADWINSIANTSDGGYILSGSSNSNVSVGKTENRNGASDYWIVKTDSTGAIQWQNTIGGNESDYLISIAQTSDGGYVLGGYSSSNISGDKNEANYLGVDYWLVKITDHYNYISGKLFIDSNGNGSQDVSERNVTNKKITENNSGRFDFSQQNGNYNVAVLGPGNYSISTDFINNYNTVPVSHNATFTGIKQTDSLNDFAFQPAGVFNDLCVTLTPLGQFRSGFHQSHMVTYSNLGTTTLNPTIIYYPDNNVGIFVSANPSANLVTSDSLVWNFGPLEPFQSGTILITLYVGAPTGTLINSEVHIEPLAGDANPGSNQSYWEMFVTGYYNPTVIYNPNEILVDKDTLLSTQFPNPPFLEYVICFQNSGNDTSFTVKVLNPIDTVKLDISTLEFVASSHPVNLSWVPWERNMQFIFNNILLPGSNVNDPQSHGFVRYRIKPKSNLFVGDTIINNAAIFFDLKTPVITDSVYTHIVLSTSLPEITTSDTLLLYPNPANTTLTIETRNIPQAGSKLTISDVAGRTLLTKTLDGNSTRQQIDIASFSTGIYFVIVEAGDGFARGRFVKE